MSVISVGIDVAKHGLDLHIRPLDQQFHFANDDAGCAKIVTVLKSLNAKNLRVCCEATGGLQNRVVAALVANGFAIAVVNPRQIRDFAKATGQRAKTDKLDASILSRFAEAVNPKAHSLPSPELRLLREFLDRRDQLLTMRTMETNRREGVGDKRLKKYVVSHVKWIDKQIKQIDTEIDSLIAANAEWKQNDERLQSIKGVGPQTAHILIGHLPELGHIGRREIAHLVGLAPMACDSGSSSRPRRIVGGRARVRKLLYMAALSSSRRNPICMKYYAMLMKKGKPAKVALVAVARKLLCIANALIRDKSMCRQETEVQKSDETIAA